MKGGYLHQKRTTTTRAQDFFFSTTQLSQFNPRPFNQEDKRLDQAPACCMQSHRSRDWTLLAMTKKPGHGNGGIHVKGYGLRVKEVWGICRGPIPKAMRFSSPTGLQKQNKSTEKRVTSDSQMRERGRFTRSHKIIPSQSVVPTRAKNKVIRELPPKYQTPRHRRSSSSRSSSSDDGKKYAKQRRETRMTRTTPGFRQSASVTCLRQCLHAMPDCSRSSDASASEAWVAFP